jgi:hypothetical protein
MRAETSEVIEGIIASCFPDTSRCEYALWMMDTCFANQDDPFAYDMSDIRWCYVYEGPLAGGGHCGPTSFLASGSQPVESGA